MSTNLISSNSKWKEHQHQAHQYAFHNLSSSFTNNITHPVMSHRYSLRPHAKGRRGHQTVDESGGQVKGTTSQSTSTDGILASEGEHDILIDELEDKPSTFESRPTAPYSSRAAHNTSTPTQDSEEDWRRTTRYRVQGPAETSEEIQAARKRVEARYITEASRIRREQTVRGYGEDLRALRARIEALCREREVRVEKTRRKWERDWPIRGGRGPGEVGEAGRTGGEKRGCGVLGLNRKEAEG